MWFKSKSELVHEGEALPGRAEEFSVPEQHRVLGTPLRPPFPDGLERAVFGMGCFWGAEELFWKVPGVYTTAVGYAGGFTANPSYEEVCTGRTGHTEVALVVYDPEKVTYGQLLRVFWERHDPTQGMRQGNDVGTQYRSVILTSSDGQLEEAKRSRDIYQEVLRGHGNGDITTEIAPETSFFYAEAYHQQYLAVHVNGYRCHSTTGVPFPEDS
ncbi:MAG TPA: peptide-methionine (S)-S-oxide reductase MsrA [Acidimicrobiia bacterium]|jgi:peptide-methionine (S)-S-oxide reductase|nr:peptide-methionine (S)-S-oxide reductase MsrA [Acidimicrobiia bacterium]